MEGKGISPPSRYLPSGSGLIGPIHLGSTRAKRACPRSVNSLKARPGESAKYRRENQHIKYAVVHRKVKRD